MEFKGTQGNWYLTETPTVNCVSIRSDNGQYIGFLSLNVVRPALMDEQKPINEANAKLISKSPELLEMVKKLHNLLEEHQPNWYLLGHHKEIENLIKEATTI